MHQSHKGLSLNRVKTRHAVETSKEKDKWRNAKVVGTYVNAKGEVNSEDRNRPKNARVKAAQSMSVSQGE